MSVHKEIIVEKRDGTKEPYDVSKIKKSIQFACEGQDVNPLELESTLTQFLKQGIKTRDIQLNVIQHAVQLATPASPDWLSVAGRALAMDEWANFPLRGKSFKEIVHYNVKKGAYSKDLADVYSDNEIDELASSVKMNRDLEYSYASLITAKKKYLGKYELNQHMHMVNAMRFGQYEPKESRIKFVKEVYNYLSLRKISLATPFLSNLRKGGNIASCFILSIGDDLESIFDNVKRVAKISKNGGGLGIYLGNLRAKGDNVNGYENSAGTVVQWVKIFNDTLVAVNQGGKRKGAATLALPIWHNDILDFLDMQTEHGDMRAKAYDVFPQITIPDIFMERDRNKEQWITFSPFEVKRKLGIDLQGLHGQAFTDAYLKIEQAFSEGKLKVARKIDNARDLTKIIMRAQFETGLPYLAFTDTINETNPNKGDYVYNIDCGNGIELLMVGSDLLSTMTGNIKVEDATTGIEIILGQHTTAKIKKISKSPGSIPCVNLCTESFSNVIPDKHGHVCNLASIVLGNVKDMNELAKIASLTCKILDYGINLTNAPDPITSSHNSRYRTIGIGLQGLHDHLAREYMNFRDLDYIREISECVEYNAAMQSVELAKRFGPFDAYKNSEWKNGNRVNEFKKHQSGKYDWDLLQENINKYGMRNSELTSPAPNCHSLDDEIKTANGNTTIGKILENEGVNLTELYNIQPHWIELKFPIKIYTPFTGDDEYVERIWWNGIQETIDITFEDGKTYSFTPNHKLLVRTESGDMWVAVKDITEDIKVCSSFYDTLKISSIAKGKTIPTADFEVPVSHAYYMGNGIISHNTSTSIYMDSSASILPIYETFFSEDNKNGKMVVAAKYLKQNPIGYSKTFSKHTATEIIDVVSELQKFIDTGVSMELIFDQNSNDFSAKVLYNAIHYAHSKKIKSIYYIRTIKKNASITGRQNSDDTSCVACAG